MSASAPQSEERVAGEPRQAGVIRLARFSVYPRGASEHSLRTGFTRDASDDALRLVTTTPEAVGELLRVHIQDIGDGDPGDVLARVVSCEHCGNGRFELSLERLDALRPRFVRRSRA